MLLACNKYIRDSASLSDGVLGDRHMQFACVLCAGILQTHRWNHQYLSNTLPQKPQFWILYLEKAMVAMISFLYLEDSFSSQPNKGVYITTGASQSNPYKETVSRIYSSTVAVLDPESRQRVIGFWYDVDDDPLRGFRLLVTFHQVGNSRFPPL